MGNSHAYSFLHDKYGGEEGYRKHREDRQIYHTKYLPQDLPQVISPTVRQVEPVKPAIHLEQVQERVIPAIDLHFYNCLYTHEYKAGPIYEDCLYDDDEMKLSSFVDHGVMFDPAPSTPSSDQEVSI